MKAIVIFPFIAALSLNAHNSVYAQAIHHTQDGLVSEWPDSSFQSDKGTNIRYAADNDGQNLYVAMKIPDFRMQMKMMRMGMNFYIDLKGKKKEGRGIEFPIKRENEGGFGGGGGFGNNQNNQSNQGNDQNQQGGNQQRGFDKKAMRSRFAIYMLSMKLFGFTDDESAPQELQKEGSANLNYSWDSTDVMYIEYLVPLKLLGDAASLNQKTISIGWKINGIDIPSNATPPVANAPSTSRRGGSGGSPNQGNSSNGGGPNQFNMDKGMEEQSFWTKYTFH